MEKIYHLKFLLTFCLLVFVFFSSKSAYACDPLGCLLAGKDQDILAIVTITDVVDSKTTVKTDHYYEQSRQTPEESFFIDFQKGAPWVSITPQIGEHYFVSLACEESVCFPKWGVWQVDGTDYQTTQLLHVQNGDDAAVEWFMNGKGSNFYGIGENMYTRTNSGDFEIYPKKESQIFSKTKEETSPSFVLWINTWQTLLGSALGPFLAIILSALGFLISERLKEKKEYKENLRRIEIGTTKVLNELIFFQDQIQKNIEKIYSYVSEMRKDITTDKFEIGIINFSLREDIYRDTEMPLLKVGSPYLHNKLLFLDDILKEINRTTGELKVDFQKLLDLNVFLSTRSNPTNQREVFIKNLTMFADVLNNYSIKQFPIVIKLIVQINFYNDLLRENTKKTLKKHEPKLSFWQRKKKKIQQKESITNLNIIDRIDSEIENEVQKKLTKIEEKRAEINKEN